MFRQLQKSEAVMTTNSSRAIAVRQNDGRPVLVHESFANGDDVRPGAFKIGRCFCIKNNRPIQKTSPARRPGDHFQMTFSTH
jgi:hypothetical protein